MFCQNCVTCPSIRTDPGIPPPGYSAFRDPGSVLILGQVTQYGNPYLICIAHGVFWQSCVRLVIVCRGSVWRESAECCATVCERCDQRRRRQVCLCATGKTVLAVQRQDVNGEWGTVLRDVGSFYINYNCSWGWCHDDGYSAQQREHRGLKGDLEGLEETRDATSWWDMDGARIGTGGLHSREKRNVVTNCDQGGQKNGQG